MWTENILHSVFKFLRFQIYPGSVWTGPEMQKYSNLNENKLIAFKIGLNVKETGIFFFKSRARAHIFIQS